MASGVNKIKLNEGIIGSVGGQKLDALRSSPIGLD